MVNIAAIFYIVQIAIAALLMLVAPYMLSSYIGVPVGRFTFTTFLGLLGGSLIVAMCIGLIRRQPWARWLAVSYSLMGWTAGLLALLQMAVGLIKAPKMVMLIVFAFTSFAGFVSLLIFLFFVAFVVVSFKLFFYLRSPEGIAEFGVELDSDASVAKSAGVWVACYLLIVLFADLNLGSFASSRRVTASAEAEHDRARESARRSQRESERQLAERREADRREFVRQEAEAARHEAERQEARRQDAERLLAEQAEREAAALYSERQAPSSNYPDSAARVTRQTEASETESQGSSRDKILRCRDASGSTQYTQGYCPPGTTRVDPAGD